ncbi:iron-sulfur cluster biosynthesis family protein [Virgibacillus senegalensis]|uniref:iron-sulfur cluster biosynthesis family protein n=1 Tax=Virgibacillus senegalensis TaxID=1499679 RepID=UPI00069EDA30|nr:iron-sulfur cluster biosynthesis family protein [Virgibacillus senegalensis]
MYLAITEAALARLNEEMKANQKNYLQIYYDTEGCCGVNGVPTIRLRDEKHPEDLLVDNESLSVIVHPQQTTFFEKEMKLDFNQRTFRLTSPQGVLNAFISPQDLDKEVTV